MVPEWQAWTHVGLVAAALVAALVVRQRAPERRQHLPHAHVAAAAIIGVIAWDWLLLLPDQVAAFFGLTAGLDAFPGRSALEAFTAATLVATLLAVVAAAGILWRAPWAIALGIGVCVVFVAATVMGTVVFLETAGPSMDDPALRSYLWFALGRVVPSLAAIALLVWPLLRSAASAAPSTDAA